MTLFFIYLYKPIIAGLRPDASQGQYHRSRWGQSLIFLKNLRERNRFNIKDKLQILNDLLLDDEDARNTVSMKKDPIMINHL